jgi:hypothetical protein
MNKINLEKLIGPVLAELWARHPALAWTRDPEGPLKPLYPVDAFSGQVIVLGLNPSYNPDHRDCNSYAADYHSKGYFKRIGDFMRQADRKYQELSQQVPNNLHGQLPTEPSLQWCHLDLLYVRATSQRVLESNIWATSEASAFCWEQLQITKNLLIHLRPKMLIVANRFGQRLTGFNRDKNTGANEWMGLQFTAEPDANGMHRIIGSTTAGEIDSGSALDLIGILALFTNSFAGTSVRSAANDEKLTTQIAAACVGSDVSSF